MIIGAINHIYLPEESIAEDVEDLYLEALEQAKNQQTQAATN